MVVLFRMTADSKGVARATRGSFCPQPKVHPERRVPMRPDPARRTPVSRPSRGWRCLVEARSTCSVVRTIFRSFWGQPQVYNKTCPKNKCISINKQMTALSLLRGNLKEITISAIRSHQRSGICSLIGRFFCLFSGLSKLFGKLGKLGKKFSMITTCLILDNCASIYHRFQYSNILL